MMDNIEEKIANRCWKHIGVFGDFSCPLLKEQIHCKNCDVFTSAGRGMFASKKVNSQLLNEWTTQISQPKKNEILGDFGIVPFRLKQEWFALDTRHLVGTTDVLPVHSVPHRSNQIFRGLVNINGELIVTMSAYQILGIDEGAVSKQSGTIYRRMITVVDNADKFVIEVDEVLRSQRFSSDEIKKPPATLSKSVQTFTRGILSVEDKELSLIDEPKFFNIMAEALNKNG